MKNRIPRQQKYGMVIGLIFGPLSLLAQHTGIMEATQVPRSGVMLVLVLLLMSVFTAALFLACKVWSMLDKSRKETENDNFQELSRYLANMDSVQIGKLLTITGSQPTQNTAGNGNAKTVLLFVSAVIGSLLPSASLFAQSGANQKGLLSETGIIITITLILIPILAAIGLMIVKLSRMLQNQRKQQDLENAERLAAYLSTLPPEEVNTVLQARKHWILH